MEHWLILDQTVELCETVPELASLLQDIAIRYNTESLNCDILIDVDN